jgi:hypothetical protein
MGISVSIPCIPNLMITIRIQSDVIRKEVDRISLNRRGRYSKEERPPEDMNGRDDGSGKGQPPESSFLPVGEDSIYHHGSNHPDPDSPNLRMAGFFKFKSATRRTGSDLNQKSPDYVPIRIPQTYIRPFLFIPPDLSHERADSRRGELASLRPPLKERMRE